MFVFPSSGQTFPLTGSMLFQVQPVSGAHGYLWSFVQNGAIVWQNLAWDGRLGGATYSVGKGWRGVQDPGDWSRRPFRRQGRRGRV